MRRIVTSDLMFGHMIAPPPRDASVQLDSDLVDVLSCFTDHGTPTTSQLSPIAMVISHTHTLNVFVKI